MNGVDIWFNETLYPDWGQRFRIVREIARHRSPYQDIAIVETASHGRMLVLDGVVQITESDEFIYQEMLAHVPLIAHGNPRTVLIIGAGDGGILRRVLQHRSVQRAVMVEIDEAVVRLSREHLPMLGGDAWNDPRTDLRIGDGIAHVREADPGTYDVIIVDSTDPIGVGEVLFTEAFYADCARVLSRGGIIVNQCGVPFMQADELRETSLRRAKAFADVSAYVAAVPTYVGGLMTLGWASNSHGLRDLTVAEIGERAERAGILGQTRYWTPAVHLASFALPPYVSVLLPSRSALS